MESNTEPVNEPPAEPTPDDYLRMANEALAEAAAIEESVADERAAIKALEDEAEALRKEYQAKIDAVTTQKHAFRTKSWDIEREARKKKQEAESYLRQKEQAERAALAAQEWATLETRWDRLTMGAPWREWAKDHQINGAKKITYEGRLILGDTMGLGKTLTSLIAIDMIEAATREASLTNPVEFGSMK